MRRRWRCARPGMLLQQVETRVVLILLGSLRMVRRGEAHDGGHRAPILSPPFRSTTFPSAHMVPRHNVRISTGHEGFCCVEQRSLPFCLSMLCLPSHPSTFPPAHLVRHQTTVGHLNGENRNRFCCAGCSIYNFLRVRVCLLGMDCGLSVTGLGF